MYSKVCSVIIASVILLSLCFTNEVMADCHNDDQWNCEDLTTHLISFQKWDEPNNNTIRFYVNNEHWSDPPDFSPDVTDAAAAWSRVNFKGVEIRFELKNKGSTEQTPEYQGDDVNTIGWGHHDSGVLAEVFTVTDSHDDNLIIEQDMLVNYYEDFANHSDDTDQTYCLQEVLTHEFGHFVRLEDVQDGIPSSDDCVHYAHFTMFEEAEMDNEVHTKETLACEDKYGLWYTYHPPTTDDN